MKALVASLGAESAREREEAQKRLARLGRAAVPFLKEAVNSPDPEVSTRAREVLAGLLDGVENGRPPLGVVELSRSSDTVIDLQISKDCRRWTAVCGKSVMIGTVDEEGGKPVVSAVYALPGWIVNGFVLDEGRKCFTLGYDGMMTMWGIDRADNAGKP